MKSLVYLLLVSMFGTATAVSEELTSTDAERTGLNVTIYNSNIALIKDRRDLQVPLGVSTVAIKDVSANILPQTAILTAEHLRVIEQNFEYDLLNEQALLTKFVGKKVSVVTENPINGETVKSDAVILSNNQGVMLKMTDGIRRLTPQMQIIYDHLPENLRDKPTLTLTVDNRSGESQPIELTYLSEQLSWKADYVAELETADKLNLKGWVTLTNHSGTDYPDTQLQLVAGEVNRLQPGRPELMAMDMTMQKRQASVSHLQQEPLFEYHLYTLAQPTTIKNKQKKQVSLLEAQGVPYKKHLMVYGGGTYGWHKWRGDLPYQKLPVTVKLSFENKAKNTLGLPMPAGVIRTYQKDQQGRSQFIGEDSINHTPENEQIELVLGEAFDITARHRQTDFQQYEAEKQNAVSSVRQQVTRASYEVVLQNAKSEAVRVAYLENFMGQWSIDEQSLNSEKLDSKTNRWFVNIPAKGETKLTYTVTLVY